MGTEITNMVLYGQTKEHALAAGTCLNCKELAQDRCHSESGLIDYHIHGVCEECVVELFKKEKRHD